MAQDVPYEHELTCEQLRMAQERRTRIFRDPDLRFDLFISMLFIRGDLVAAGVMKTCGYDRIAQFDDQSNVTSFDVMVAQKVLTNLHSYDDCEGYFICDNHINGRRFSVEKDKLTALLDHQRESLGPVRIPSYIANGRFPTPKIDIESDQTKQTKHLHDGQEDIRSRDDETPSHSLKDTISDFVDGLDSQLIQSDKFRKSLSD